MPIYPVMRSDIGSRDRKGRWAAPAPPAQAPAGGAADLLEAATEELRRSEERFSVVFHSSPQPMSMSTLHEGRVLDVNEGYARFFGFRREEMIGRLVGDLGLWVTLEERDAIIRLLETHGRVRNAEVRFRKRSGEIGHALLSTERLALSGEPTVVTTVTDITERKLSEEATRALAEVGRDLTGSLDLGHVANRLVSAVVTLFGARVANLYRRETDPDGLVCIATAGEAQEPRWLGIRVPPGSGVTSIALREGRLVSVADILTDPRVTLDPEYREHMIAKGHGATVAVPLSVGGRSLGVLAVGYSHGRVLTPEEERLLSMFADQAALALESARVRGEIEQRRREAEALALVAQRLTETLDVEEVGQRIVEHVLALFGAQSAVVRLLDPDGGLRLIAVGGPGQRRFELGHVLPPGVGVTGRAVSEGRPVSSTDITDDPAVRASEDFRTHVAKFDIRAMAAVPLRTKGAVVGALAVGDRTGRVFTANDVRLLQAFADQAAIAIRNAELFSAERSSRAQAEASERAQRESEARFRRIFESNMLGLMFWDENDNALDVNDALLRMLGYTREDLEAGRLRWRDLTPPEHVERTEKAREEIKASGVCAPFEKEYIRKDGRRVSVLVGGAALEGDRERGVAFILDSTPQKRLEAQLRQAQKMEAVGRLAGGIAHDFNNLLTVIGGRSLLALEDIPATNPIRGDLELIQQTVERAAALTRQLLAFSRKQLLQTKALDLNGVVAGIVPLLRRLIGEDIELTIGPGVAVGRVKADPAQLEQVIVNLAVNARDAMPQGGRLVIETANADLPAEFNDLPEAVPAGSYAMLKITDTGVGMNATVQAHLFEPFFTTKEVGKGTGLGLATVHGIVRQHGGSIRVYSAPGEGTTFKIYLPQTSDPLDAYAPGASGAPRSRGAERVLLVEDDPDVRALTQTILERGGYEVLSARDGHEALRLFREQGRPIQLLVSDVVMPKMSGRELADRLRVLQADLKVLYVSGYTQEALGRHGVLEPGIVLLPKPFQPVAMLDKVREVLDTDMRPQRGR
jgi:PAS domain S-box-containing protein